MSKLIHRDIMRKRLIEMFGLELARELMFWHVVHHKDHNHQNNDIGNLMLITAEEHTSHHHTGRRKYGKKCLG